MKVKKLIEILSKADPDMDVQILDEDGVIQNIIRITTLDTSFGKFLALMYEDIDVMAKDSIKKVEYGLGEH